MRIPTITPRDYQVPTFEYFDDTTQPGLRAVDVWSRRMGKDLTYMNVACKASFQRKGLYVHFLPEFAHARRTIWDGFSNEGERLIDLAFPPEIRTSTNETEMRIELVNGSVWQLGGSDQYDRWVGGNPIGLAYSEFALAHPKGWELMRPILKLNGGWAAFLSTPRGYNHLHSMLELAKKTRGWHWSHINALDVGLMTRAEIDLEIEQGMPEELARQEYLCDFSAANVGAILGKYIEAAEKEGRLHREPLYDPSAGPIAVSCDIGFRDTAAFWFWQLRIDGFALVHYVEDNGLDAEEWIDRLGALRYRIEDLYLPHDARAKTFATRHSVVEQFLRSKLAKNVHVVPQVKTQDRINAARSILPRCHFDYAGCAQGLLALREWSFKWSDDRRTYSREPDHNWASHGSDGFTYGALMLHERVKAPRKRKQPIAVPLSEAYTLDRLFEDQDRAMAGRRRI
jgi:phage terminase large subunit